MKKRNIIITMLVAVCLFAGCKSTVQGTYLTDDEVVAEVEKHSGTEKISIVSKFEENGRVKYTLRTSERGIEFDIASLPVGKSGGFNFAHVSINDYHTVIQKLYRPAIDELKNDLVMNRGAVVFSNRDELRAVCEKFEEMDAICKEELKYHDAEYLKQFPADRIVISRRENPDEQGDFSYTIPIDGTIDAAELEQFVLDLYKERTGKDL